MSKIPLSYQQHRHVIGHYTNRQDKKQKNQKYQDDYIQGLAKVPGRHTQNVRRQDIAHTVLHLISILSVVRNCSINQLVTPKRTNELNMVSCRVANEARCYLQETKWNRQPLINDSNRALAEMQKKDFLSAMSTLNERQVYPSMVNLKSRPGSIYNELKTILYSVTNGFYKIDQFISQYDPLKFPEVVAFSKGNKVNEQAVIRNSNVRNLDDIQLDEKYLMNYYDDYYSKYPTLTTLAETTLKNQISAHFNLQIDPNKASLMAFSIMSHHGDDKIHYPPVWKNKTLTKWLFANVEAELDEIHIEAGMYGIYNITEGPKQEYHVADQLKIKPREFFQLVRKIDFSHYAKEKLVEFFKHKDEHIKKYFIDFVNHLYSSRLDDEAAKDVLVGIGVFKDRKIQVCVFDIDGYLAFNAFVFRNETNRVIIYLPESHFKFISFYDDAAMRSWMKDICAAKRNRNMIASHFAMTNRQDRNGHYGIDTWLKIIHKDDDAKDIIATKFIKVLPNSFFEYLFNQTRNNTLSDLDYLMKLEDGIRDVTWEKMIDSSNIRTDTIPFLSLKKEMKYRVKVSKNNKKMQNFKRFLPKVIKIVRKVTLSKLLNFNNKEGYDFINTVIQGMDRATSEKSEPKLEERVLKPDNFLQTARKHLTEFYEDYNSKYPDLYRLARSILKEKIQARFHLSIDPNEVRFMHFDNVVYADGEKLHYSPARENKTLTEWLFTNFDAETQDNLQDMDSMCAIYDRSVWEKEVFKSSDELKIKPTDFIQLVYDIDFYNYAKNKLTAFFKDKDTHIKKYFIDLVNYLDISDIGDEAGKDVLAGVGIGKTRNVRTFLFDIDGYFASTAFIFRNEDGRVTLYFPGSDVKFMSFRGDFEMREWVTNACSTKEHRDMIAAHFTIKNRQDGIFYYGVDAWLKSINQNNDYYDKIAIKRKEIEPAHFFEFLFTQIKEKTISDLDHLIKSDAEIRRDMWEEMIDASNIIPNPISPFLSLGIHLEHALEADTYEEKQQEWNKIASDTVDIVVFVTLSKIMSFPNVNGYKFIHIVNEAAQVEDIKKAIQASEMRVRVQHLTQEHFDPDLLSLNGLFDGQGENNIIADYQPLKSFLPLREIKLESDVNKIDNFLKIYLTDKLKNNPYDIFYGFNEEPHVNIPQYIRNGHANLRMNIKIGKKCLEEAQLRLHDSAYKPYIIKYLSIAFGTTDSSMLIQATERLIIQVERAYNFLLESEARGFENFGIVSTRQVSEPNNPLSFHSVIDRNILQTMVAGFTFKEDSLRRLFFLNDAMPIINPNGINSLGDERIHLDQTVIHEISHSSFNSMDFYYNKINLRTGRRLCGAKTLLRLFNRYMRTGKLKEGRSFNDFMRDVYKYLNINKEFNRDAALNILKNDPLLRINFMMENADNFVAYVKGIGEIKLSSKSKRDDHKIFKNSVVPYLGLIFTATKNHDIKIKW